MLQHKDPGPTRDPIKPIKLIVILFLVASITLVIIYSTRSNPTRLPTLLSPNPDDPTRDFQSLCDYALNTTHLAIPNYPPDATSATNLSHVVFGIGGYLATWHERRWYSESWWRRNLTRGFVWLDKVPGLGTEWPVESPPYRVSEDWSRFKFMSSDSAVRMARIVVEAFRLGLPEVRWFVMGDDDTLFFVDNLVTVLSRYDHREMYYIGGISESIEQDVIHTYNMAFGGGGFAVSYPLAAALASKMDGCLDRYYEFYGSDQRVWACISEIGVSLTMERGFHQIDLREDIYGLLAAHPISPLVSLHHLDYVKPLFPRRTQTESLQTLIQAYRVDPAQTLQQTFCYDFTRNWSVSISWGYTTQIYTNFVTGLDLATPQQTFKTWRSWGDGPFTFNTRAVSSDPCQQPIVYFLEKVKEVAKGWSLSTYAMNVVEKQKECYKDVMNVTRVAVLAPKMDPREWKMAIRRRCCEISEGLKKKIMLVKIRRCEPGETVSF